MRRTILAATLGAGLVLGSAAPASAADQEGLVNVNVEDVTVQVPVAAALNLCDIDIAVLAELVGTAGSCDADARSVAQSQRGNGGSTRQEGLVNVNLEDVVVQVPIAAALNLCDVDLAVLAGIAGTAGTCDAVAGSGAGA